MVWSNGYLLIHVNVSAYIYPISIYSTWGRPETTDSIDFAIKIKHLHFFIVVCDFSFQIINILNFGKLYGQFNNNVLPLYYEGGWMVTTPFIF